MSLYPVFVSVIYVVRDQGEHLDEILKNAVLKLESWVRDYELIVVDNASSDQSVHVLEKLTGLDGLPNLQVYTLTRKVSNEVAVIVGLENALGDIVTVIDFQTDDLAFLPKMLEKAIDGVDVVFANNQQQVDQTLAYRVAYKIFNMLFQFFNGIHLTKEAPNYRILSRRVVNFILQHAAPATTYRHLPATGGFSRVNMDYSSPPLVNKTKKIGESIDRGVRLLVSTTKAPIRIVTSLSFLGATVNLFYSLYVMLVGLIKSNVAPGWISLSLQQSGMFFLFSLVLLILGEYILHMSRAASKDPLYHVSREFTSAQMHRRDKLNVDIAPPPPRGEA